MNDKTIIKRKINNVQVSPVFIAEPAKDKIKGYDCVPFKKFNTFLCAKKASGKTNVIFEILKQKAGKNTSIIVFSSSFYNDNMWRIIEDYFEKNGIGLIGYNSLKSDGNSILGEFIKKMQAEGRGIHNDSKVDEEDDVFVERGGKVEKLKKPKPKPKPKKPKLESADYIFVFDDLANELKNNADLRYWITYHRHFESANIISSQFFKHLYKENRANMDEFILFPGMSSETLKDIHKECGLSISYDVFEQLYNDACSKKYNTLVFEPSLNRFRHNFDEIYEF